jgi:hypothetical protein
LGLAPNIGSSHLQDCRCVVAFLLTTF